MKHIKVSKKNIGECIINSEKDLNEANEFIIKSMAAIQMLCMGRNSTNDPKLKNLIEILDDSMQKIDELYNDDTGVSDESDPFRNYEG